VKMERMAMPNGDVILVRDLLAQPGGDTLALISWRRRYGIWNINRSRWFHGPFRQLVTAQESWDALVSEGWEG